MAYKRQSNATGNGKELTFAINGEAVPQKHNYKGTALLPGVPPVANGTHHGSIRYERI